MGKILLWERSKDGAVDNKKATYGRFFLLLNWKVEVIGYRGAACDPYGLTLTYLLEIPLIASDLNLHQPDKNVNTKLIFSPYPFTENNRISARVCKIII